MSRFIPSTFGSMIEVPNTIVAKDARMVPACSTIVACSLRLAAYGYWSIPLAESGKLVAESRDN